MHAPCAPSSQSLGHSAGPRGLRSHAAVAAGGGKARANLEINHSKPLGRVAYGATPQWRRVAARPGRASRSTTPSRRRACGNLAGGPLPSDTSKGPAQPTSPASQPDHLARQHNPATQPSNTTQQHNPATQPSNTNARQPAGPPRVRHTVLGHSWHRGTVLTRRAQHAQHAQRARQAAEDRVISACAKPPPRRPGQR